MEKIILVLVSAIICPGVVFGAALSKTVLYQAPDECKWSGFSENDIVLVCSLRTINSELERTNFSVIQAQNTVRLRLECNEGLYYRSSLGDGSFSTLSELRELTIDYCKLNNISDGAFRGLSDLRNLTIRTHNSDWSTMRLELSSESFIEFRQLDYLDLSLNNIWTIPEGLLCPLKILTHLNMSYNEIQDLSNFHFSASLTSRKSRICVFSALVRLKKLNLARNNMNYIADRALEGLVSLTTIDLSDNQLTSLPPELFSETKNIKEIYLRNNSINVLAPGIFSELADLLVLDLAKNELNSQWINIATFAGLKLLQLSNNYIDSIPENTFIELTNLHTLVLSHNRLTNIGPMTFYGLFGISILSLDFNRINKIDAIAFKNCSSLQELHINSNKLQRVPEALAYVPLLKTLDIGENLITNIENTSLNLLESLYGLRLTENLIDIIKRGVFDRMKSLQILNLSKNKVRHIEPGSFHKNIQLQAIRLDENHLKSIAGLFNELPTLMLLNISNNHMEKFDYSHIPNRLQWLDISANRINELSNYFEIESDISLTTFDASSNRLTEVTANSIPNSIEVLSLKNNHITTIQPYTFFKKPNLTSVDLFGNKLTTLEPNALRLSPVPAHKALPEFSIGEIHLNVIVIWIGYKK
uniref:LRRCT domain-containing protein n=1 Tax=Megaselia scalaris TaxID=36166 RepID=T1GBB4_MEGSC